MPDTVRAANEWASEESPLCELVLKCSAQSLEAYRVNPNLIKEHANIERAIAQGGYGRRQLYELVQNSSDAIHNSDDEGVIHVLLTDDALYCANNGQAVTEEGVVALLNSHVSAKRGFEVGRFGLGFKSVLEITDNPQIFSQSGSFEFDRRAAARAIQDVYHQAERTPCLRVAQSLDIHAEASKDTELAALMTWATTIIKMPRHHSRGRWLSEDIVAFPPEFMLFSAHVSKVILEDRTQGVRREFRLQRQADIVFLEENGREPSFWKLYETVYRPTPEARREAGELTDREELPFMWAVPLKGRLERGEFWAFFPTKYRTTLSGVLNAPWKTNEDRQNLLESRFNTELINAAAKLIATSLPNLANSFADDAGKYLTLLPARGREAPNWADDELTSSVYRFGAVLPSLPDQDRQMRLPRHLKLPPDNIPEAAYMIWNECSWRQRDWVHFDALRGSDRRSRVRRLIQEGGGEQSSSATWLEALVTENEEWSAAASAAALKAAAEIVKVQSMAEGDAVRQAPVLLTSDGRWVAPKSGTVFSAIGAGNTSVPTVHSDVVQVPGVLEALELFGIGQVDASSELKQFLAGYSPIDLTDRGQWKTFWQLVRSVPLSVAETAVRDWLNEHGQSGEVRICTKAGRFTPISWALLPGTIVSEDGSRDRTFTVDTDYHAADLSLLKVLGLVGSPESITATSHEPWLSDYRHDALKLYDQELVGHPSRPQQTYLVFQKSPFTGPLNILASQELSQEGQVRYTEAVLASAVDDKPWELHHTSREQYPRMDFPSPSVWVAKRYGLLRTSLGLFPVGECVSSELQSWSGFFPVAQCSVDIQKRLALPQDWGELGGDIWSAALLRATNVDNATDLGAFYAFACDKIWPPESINCFVGSELEKRPPGQVTAVADQRILNLLVRQRIPVVAVKSQEDARLLMQEWQLNEPEKYVTVRLHISQSGPAVPLADLFLGLYMRMGSGAPMDRLIPCSSIWEEVVLPDGSNTEDLEFACEADQVFYLDTIEESDLLDWLCNHYGITLSDEDRAAFLQNRSIEAHRLRLSAISNGATIADRLITAVGEEVLKGYLPEEVKAAASERFEAITPEVLAELVLGVYGVETLYVLRDALTEAGLQPPVQWSGSHQAKRFVQELGFPKEFGGFGEPTLDPSIYVDGPAVLPPLHDFQKEVLKRVQQLFRSRVDGESMRGLLSLPTGAGKTRIAVEAAVRSMKDGTLERPVLWIAQSEELCEQAVQAWREVWQFCGSHGPLRINRFWGANDADYFEGGNQVVVATMQKLYARIDHEEYDWLSEASCIIIDEAHHAITPAYTRILHWLGLVRRDTPRPLLGLTATPFRGGEEETNRLAARFSRNRLDAEVLGNDSYRSLQIMNVLSEVDHQLLSGVHLDLNPQEVSQVESMGLRWLPKSAEQRLGSNTSRTSVIVKSLLCLPEDWPVIVFAPSVDSAHTLAALLNTSGVSAASIYSEMRPGARRHYIERFRSGEVRVLTNYGVLTTGFDAPAVRAVYVARPTFSPVLYQQMVGRGLRGPLNGGKERCLIVNVDDTFRQFGDKLAFRQFDFLWQ